MMKCCVVPIESGSEAIMLCGSDAFTKIYLIRVIGLIVNTPYPLIWLIGLIVNTPYPLIRLIGLIFKTR